jgi:hypothetical protein
VILGIPLPTFTTLHVAISLFAIVSGFIALLIGPLGSRTAAALTALFLASTLATSVTGFMFPFTRLGPGHITGALTLVALVPTLLALYRHRLAGSWRRIYAVGATMGLYLNVFIAVLHAFGKMTVLHPLTPKPAAPSLFATQFVVLALFVALFLLAGKRPH